MPSTVRPNSIRVLLIDDSPLIRLGLKSALEDYADIKIVGEAANAADGLGKLASTIAEVVLLDLHLPDKSGIEVCREIRRLRPTTRVLMLTSDGNMRNVQAALQAGAAGYLLKENDGAALAAAIRETAAGASVLDQALKSRPAEANSAQAQAIEKLRGLSNQEQRVVTLLASGLTNREIGEQLGLTEKTVKNYLATIFVKLNITRRTQAVALHLEATHEA